MVAAKESPAGDELPKTIPDLMLRYLNELNRNTGGEDNRTVQRDCKVIAWECLKASYRPGPAERAAVIAALKGDGGDEQAAEARLGYLVHRLRVIQVTGAAEDRIRFALDPLAEYLAGMVVVEENRGNKQRWERFFQRADRMTGAPESIRGFLLAVRDCCLASMGAVPDFVPDELLQRLQLQQRVRDLTANLSLPCADDRRAAANALAGIGPKAEAAIPALLSAFQDDDEEVRDRAAEALVEIGPVSIPALIDTLNNELPDVRFRAAYVLGKFGSDAEPSIEGLINLLKDDHPTVRRRAAETLGIIGPVSQAAIPPLTKMLQDEDNDDRRFAEQALGRIKSGAPKAASNPTKRRPRREARPMAASPAPPGTTEVFFSYAHEDEPLLGELLKHLGILKRLGVIRDWHDRKITAGTEWKGQIDQHLDSAGVILLLVSADFIASDYCWDVEMKRAMERHDEGEARVIPVILRPVDGWQPPRSGSSRPSRPTGGR